MSTSFRKKNSEKALTGSPLKNETRKKIPSLKLIIFLRRKNEQENISEINKPKTKLFNQI